MYFTIIARKGIWARKRLEGPGAPQKPNLVGNLSGKTLIIWATAQIRAVSLGVRILNAFVLTAI